MSIGNLKNSGNQGNNFPWQLKMLEGLQAIYDEVKLPLTCIEDSVTICNANIDNLTFTTDSGTDSLNVHITNPIPLEVNLTCDDAVSICVGGANVGTGNPLPINGVVSVTGEVEVINAVGSPIPVTVVAPVPVINVNLDAADDQVGVYGYINGVSSTPTPLNVNASGHVAIQDGGNSITVDGGTGVQRTPTISRVSASSSVAAGAYSVSFASVGTANATVGGATLKPGETINFDAGAINNTLGAITYNSSGAGAELLIITLT